MTPASTLSTAETAKREQMRRRKPRVFEKIGQYQAKVARGESIAIIQFQYDYVCNFACEHCSVANQMLNTPSRRAKYRNARSFTHTDVRELSRQGDEMGLANMVITGGEPMLYRDFDQLVEAIDPSKWYIASDTNGWLFDLARAKHVKSIGVDKIQISLDGLDEAQHDSFRRKTGSYRRVMAAIEAARDAELDINLSTVVWKSRIRSGELARFIEWADQNDLPLYMSLAKPVGSYAGRLEEVCNSADIEYLDRLCAEHRCFTHWTPSYGMDIGCIAVKRMISVTKYGDVMPCPYTHVSLGNFFKEPLRDIINRALQIKLFAFGKKETCFVGNLDHAFLHEYLPRYQTGEEEVYCTPYDRVFRGEDFVGGNLLSSPSFGPGAPRFVPGQEAESACNSCVCSTLT